MTRLLSVGLFLAALAPLSAPTGRAQAPAGEPAKSGPAAGPRRIPLDKLKVPPGTIVVISDDPKEGLKPAARLVVLTPEEYQRLTDRLAQLERLLKGERKPPSSCKLRATVEGDFVQLQADFAFQTTEPRTAVLLGLRGAQLTDGRLRQGEGEGNLPLLEHGPTGYSVLVEKAGEYQLTLNLRLPLTFAAAERGFDLALPGAAATSLALELPYAVKEIRCNKVAQRAASHGAKEKRWEQVSLGAGPVTAVNVSWQEPAALPETGPVLTARGQVVVKLEEKQVVTTADLTLLDLRGQAREWRLWLPAQARVKVTPPEGLGYKLLPPRENVHVLQLDEATAEPIKVTATVTQPRGPRLPIGPFAVLGTLRQEGTIEVRVTRKARQGVRLQYLLNGEVAQHEPPGSHASDAVLAFFRYGNMAVPAKLIPTANGKVPAPGTAPLEIELKPANGRVATHVKHRLRVGPRQDESGGLQVQIWTTIQAQPFDEAVDYLDVQLPGTLPYDALTVLTGGNRSGFPEAVPWAALVLNGLAPHEAEEWRAGGLDLQISEQPGKTGRRARVPLPAAKKEVVLYGAYSLPRGTRRARFKLPRPLAIKDNGAQIKLESDPSLELLVEGPGLEVPAPGRHQYTFDLEGAPASVEMAWRPYRPELPADIEADLTFHENDAEVRQQFKFRFPERQGTGAAAGPPGPVRLRVPAAVRSLKVSGRWKLVPPEPGSDLALAVPPPKAGPGEPLVLEYGFFTPRREVREGKRKDRGKKGADGGEPHPFKVPLVWAEQATQTRTKVRLWATPTTVPALAVPEPDGPVWKERGTEVVPGRGLPSRVLLADGLNVPLFLRLDPAPPALAGVVIERALVQVEVKEEGLERYVARFLLTKLNTSHLDVRLPAASAALSLRMTLAGAKVTLDPPADGRVVRIPLEPGLFTRPVVLEVRYDLPRNQPEAEGPWQTALHPPEILGNVFLGRVRWQVTMPHSWVPVVAGADVHPEQVWAWDGWLPAPEPALNAAELDEWITDEKSGEEPALPSLVCTRTSLEPLRVLRLPQQAWFLLCSGAVLLVGLGLYFAPLSHYSFWAALALLGMGVVAAGALWPSVLPAVVYGSEPGLVVLVVLLGFQWMLHQRYRRQVVFMPGFKRLKPGSSLVRTSRPRDPSTVDAPTSSPPQPQGSSMKGK